MLTEVYLGQGIPTLIDQIKFLGLGLASFQLMAAPKFSIAIIYFLCVRFFKHFHVAAFHLISAAAGGSVIGSNGFEYEKQVKVEGWCGIRFWQSQPC